MLRFFIVLTTLFLIICKWANASIVQGSAGSELKATVVASFLEPWSMTFINENELLVTSKRGKLWHVTIEGKKTEVSGVPEVAFSGQGGLGDIIHHPNFIENRLVYFSYVEKDKKNYKLKGAVVARAVFVNTDFPKLSNLELIWKQTPKKQGSGHYSHKLAFGPTGSNHEGKLFITSGDRQNSLSAQDLKSSLGKLIRINENGTFPHDNPFQAKGQLAKSFWTLGHRNSLGIAFDGKGGLWAHEMGPKHGDELNFIKVGKNYGWPLVSEGDHYDGREIPNHESQPQFIPPVVAWVPTIAPSGLIFYSGEKFKTWEGNAFIGGLKSRALIRLEFSKGSVAEVERFSWGRRIREVELGPDGSIWVLEDPPLGRLIQFNPPEN